MREWEIFLGMQIINLLQPDEKMSVLIHETCDLRLQKLFTELYLYRSNKLT